MGINGEKPRVGRHLERARAAQRDRVDHRDRDPVPHAELQPRQRHLGHQLPADGPPQERRVDLDGLGAQPGPAADDQRRLVTGIRDVSQGHGLDIKPYGLVSSGASPGRGSAQ